MDDLYIGLMSGTSVDAVDAVLVDFGNDTLQILQTHAQTFPEDVRTRLQKLIAEQHTPLKDLAELDHEVAVLYALAVKKLLQLADVSASRIRAIGSHGQTIYHHPEGENPNSLQIGDPSFIAERTGIDVVADFRRHDMAAGGQGAPLVPAFHASVFRDFKTNRVILNLGGIANITVLPASHDGPVSGFDTGPANTLLDLWASRHINVSFDKNGDWASTGTINSKLLTQMLGDPYFKKSPPKSTGREYFNLDWLERYKVDDYPPEEVQATLCELTALTVANAVKHYAGGTKEVYICGGGVHNTFQVSRLQEALPTIKLASTESLGLLPDWIEATAFAWLTQQTIMQRKGNITTVTGARREVPLGGIYRAG